MNIFKEFATDKVGYYATGATAKNTPKGKDVYIIINGTTAIMKEFDSKDKAIEYAENICNHSKEIIVRKIEQLKIK